MDSPLRQKRSLPKLFLWSVTDETCGARKQENIFTTLNAEQYGVRYASNVPVRGFDSRVLTVPDGRIHETATPITRRLTSKLWLMKLTLSP